MDGSVLVIEDDPLLQTVLAKTLNKLGLEVTLARTMLEASTKLAIAVPQVILLDLGLPDGDGLTLLPSIAGLPTSPLVIVTTGDATLNRAIAALRLGAFDYLTKPILTELLFAALKRALGHIELHTAARELQRLRDQESAMRATALAAAHHMSQHLTVIMGEAQLMMEEQGDDRLPNGLQRIVHASEQAARILDDLRQARIFVTRDTALAPMLDLNAAKVTPG
ncbi:response regulator [Candidatus Gracilibacteria bacterium]|nr:response regulator [Candidatus Gracilibacteria bacterium]